MRASSTPHPRLVGRGACSPRAMASAPCRPQPAERCAMAPLRVRCALTRRRSSKCTVAARRSPAPTSSPCSRMPEARMDHVHGPQSQRERAGRVFRVCYLLFVFATYGFRQLPDALTGPRRPRARGAYFIPPSRSLIHFPNAFARCGGAEQCASISLLSLHLVLTPSALLGSADHLTTHKHG